MKKLWWIYALASTALMLLASSYPYFMLYRPWSWTREVVIASDAIGHFELPVREVDNTSGLPRTADVELRGFERVADDNPYNVYVPEGFDGWIVFTQWSAPTNSLLSGCQIWFTGSDGKEYEVKKQINPTVAGGMAAPITNEVSVSSVCTPEGKGGPRYSWPDGELDNTSPRPEEWENLVAFSMPDGVHPTAFHFGWSPPHYVTLKLPESKPFLEELVGDVSKER